MATMTSRLLRDLSEKKIGAARRTLDLCVRQGCDLNARDSEGYTAVLWAVTMNATDLLDVLIDHGADINVTTAHQGYTPLHIACKKNHAQNCRLLLSHGAEVNVKARDYTTPLYWAVERCNEDMVESLLKAGAREGKNETGNRHIWEIIIRQDRGNLASLLLKYQHNPNDELLTTFANRVKQAKKRVCISFDNMQFRKSTIYL